MNRMSFNSRCIRFDLYIRQFCYGHKVLVYLWETNNLTDFVELNRGTKWKQLIMTLFNFRKYSSHFGIRYFYRSISYKLDPEKVRRLSANVLKYILLYIIWLYIYLLYIIDLIFFKLPCILKINPKNYSKLVRYFRR